MEVAEPPRDQNGIVEPHDHPQIASGDRIIRRISEDWKVFDKKLGRWRLSSACLEPSSQEVDQYCGLSIDVESFITAAGIDPKAHVTTPKHIASIVFNVDSFRTNRFLVGYDPLPENLYHGGVWEVKDTSKLTKGMRSKLLKEAEWFVPLPGVSVS